MSSSWFISIKSSVSLYGTGCPECSKEYHKLGNKFVKLAFLTHLGRYNYTQTILRGYKEKVTITCTNCKKNIKVYPIDHLHGYGCNAYYKR